jgi:hypothetical protein
VAAFDGLVDFFRKVALFHAYAKEVSKYLNSRQAIGELDERHSLDILRTQITLPAA